MATSALGYQSFYQAQLTSAITASDLTIPLDVVPTPSEGFLVIESTSSTKREIIYYTSKTSNSVVCPSGGRGYDGTTAQSHTQNSIVIMAPVAAMFSSMRDLFETTPQGWTPVTQTVSSVTYNGNRSYSLTMSADVSSTLSPGMRVRTTRTVSAPTQCTSLNGSTQYYSRASASLTGITFTDDFTVSAWIKLNAYGANGTVIGRVTTLGTNGFALRVLSDGRPAVNMNAASSIALQSLPLNKWVHIAATVDMSGSSFLFYIDGVLVPSSNTLSGTSLTQSGNLTVGAYASGTEPFNGKIAQAAIFSAVLTASTIRSYYSQGLAGTETNLVSAYSFNNSINDLNTTNANNLTANGSAVATNADSPFSTNSFGTETGTLDYGIVTNVATTVLTVQVPEACTIPTTGGVSAMSYSTQKAPYGMPIDSDKYQYQVLLLNNHLVASVTTGTAVNLGGMTSQLVTLPIGVWSGSISGVIRATGSTTAAKDMRFSLSKTSATVSTAYPETKFNTYGYFEAAAEIRQLIARSNNIFSNTSATQYYVVLVVSGAGVLTNLGLEAGGTPFVIAFDLALL